MKRIVTVFLLIVALVSCNSNDDQVNPLENVSKKLKSIKSSTSGRIFEYGANNFITKEYINYGVDGIVGTLDYIYNSKNQIIEIKQQNKNKEVDGTFRDFIGNTTYKYDNNGLISSSYQYYKYKNEQDSTRIETVYEYNNGNLVKKIEETTDTFNNYYNIHTFYTYTNNKLISAESKLFENGAYIPGSKTVSYTYDTKINPEYSLFPKSYVMIKGYDVNNIISYFDDKNPNASYDNVFEYDKDNFPNKTSTTYKNGNEIEYFYEYQ